VPTFSKGSKERLLTCHADLQTIANEVIKVVDFTVTCGHRGQAEQLLAFESGRSALNWPNSKHNRTPSHAMDLAPYPIDWDDRGSFYLLAGYVLCTAARLYDEGMVIHRIRAGADWNGNLKTADQKFHDLPHFEII
jgi:peptidoglycan LD-endopeptidase CwlK